MVIEAVPTDIIGQLQRDEGVRLFAYDDATGLILRRGDTLKGFLTIGTGRNLTTEGISAGESGYLLRNDVQEKQFALLAACPWIGGLDFVRRQALINMAFNLGVAGVRRFDTFLQSMQNGAWSDAASDLRATAWAAEVGARAERLREQILTGQWR